MVDSEGLKSQLASLFNEASAVGAAKILAAGLPLAADQSVTTVTRTDPSGWSSGPTIESQNILVAEQGRYVIGLAPLASDDVMARAADCASVLAELAADTLPFWAPFASNQFLLVGISDLATEAADYSEDPVKWVLKSLVLPALTDHLKRLPRLDQVTSESASNFAAEVVEVATDRYLSSQVSIPLAGVVIDPSEPSQLVSAGIVMRRLSGAEQGQFIEERGTGPWALLGFDPPQVAIEYRVDGPRDAQLMTATDRAPKLVAAMQLHGFHVAGRSVSHGSFPAWVFPGVGHAPLLVADKPRATSNVTQSDLDEVIKLEKLMGAFNFQQPKSTHDLALHRFLTGMSRESETDSLLDFTITLESLLLPYDEETRRGELSYRFRLHGAHYLADDADSRKATAKALNGIYTMRSRLVHGGKYPTVAEVASVRADAYDLARRGLLQAVQSGFPTAESFNRLIFGYGG